MAKKDSIDVRTGHKLRRLELSEIEVAEQIFEALRRERESVEDGLDSVAIEIPEPTQFGVKINIP
jgi:hypothetical protein